MLDPLCADSSQESIVLCPTLRVEHTTQSPEQLASSEPRLMHKVWSTRAGLYEVHTYLHRMLQHRHRLRCITSKPPIWSNSRGNHTTSISPDSSIVRRCSHSDQTGSKVTTRTARAQRQRIIAGETAYVYIGLSHGSPEAREASHFITRNHE